MPRKKNFDTQTDDYSWLGLSVEYIPAKVGISGAMSKKFLPAQK
jgi:hypothetical protein